MVPVLVVLATLDWWGDEPPPALLALLAAVAEVPSPHLELNLPIPMGVLLTSPNL